MKATLELSDGKLLEQIILQDLKQTERSQITSEIEGDKIKIIVNAKDAVALRATLNTITGLIATFYKIKNES